MKTITEFVRSGINDPSELKEALQTAMRLEFSTLPPYLCAEWSIIDGQDPNGVADNIYGIVLQEMFHFALAGNSSRRSAALSNLRRRTFYQTILLILCRATSTKT